MIFNSTCTFFSTGGKVKFIVGNDAPTLTAAKVTFTIELQFPHNQKVMPDGEVVWAEDFTVNGKSSRTDWVLMTSSLGLLGGRVL